MAGSKLSAKAADSSSLLLYRIVSVTTKRTLFNAQRRQRINNQCVKVRTIRHSKSYATQTSLGTASQRPQSHKKVTVLNDDGRVPWGSLTRGEKIARTTQQSFNFALIVGGAALTGLVFTYLFTDVFSPQSATNHFNRAVNQIRGDERATSVLGEGKNIRAYGEPTLNKWRRNRPIASHIETDKAGNQTLLMHFNVTGPLNEGVVHLRMVRRHDDKEFHYGYLALDIPGKARIWLENADAPKKGNSSVARRFLGSRWS